MKNPLRHGGPVTPDLRSAFANLHTLMRRVDHLRHNADPGVSRYLRSLKVASVILFAAIAAPANVAVSEERLPPPDGQPPALNHIYVVLDADTFAAIRDSRDVARALGRTDGGLPAYAPPQPGADRVFFRGRQTYLEFFAPGNRFKEPVGKVGLALGYDKPVHFDMLEKTWIAFCGDKARRTRVAWQRTQPPTPWYDALQCDDTAEGTALAMWAMVYRPEFQRWQSGASKAARPRTARRDILASRVAAGQGRFDVTGVAIDVATPLHAKLVAQLEQAGFARENTRQGTLLRGDGWALTLRAVNKSPGLVFLDLDANAALSNDLPLGTARMTQRSAGKLRIRFKRRSDTNVYEPRR